MRRESDLALRSGLASLRAAVLEALQPAPVLAVAGAGGPAGGGGPRSTGRDARRPPVWSSLALSTAAASGVPVPNVRAGSRAPTELRPVRPDPESDLTPTPQVISRAQAGDAAAFGELYDEYVDTIYRYINYRVGSVQLAEDLTSETFVRALRRLPNYQWQGRDFGAWLVTIARNLIADHFKSGRYRLEMTTDDILGAAGTAKTSDGPEQQVLESMTNATLLAAVKRLSSEQQECIALRFLQGFSVAETATAMGKNEGAVKALQYRAVRTLARMLPPDLAQ